MQLWWMLMEKLLVSSIRSFRHKLSSVGLILHLESGSRGVNLLTWTCILLCTNQHFVKHFINDQKVTQKFEGENTPYREGKHTWGGILGDWISVNFWEEMKPAFCGAVKKWSPCSASWKMALNFKNFSPNPALTMHYNGNYWGKIWCCSHKSNFTRIL